jgi:ribosomal protein S18 acetylase RimI-like enzyme
MEICRFQESDEAAVAALWNGAFGYPGPHNAPANIIRHKLAVQRELFFVAFEDGELAGTVMGGYDGHRGWIYSLAVAPAFRRRGYGAALVRHVEHELAKLGCFKINLQVLASNAAVVGFYKSVGYHVEERISLGKLLE